MTQTTNDPSGSTAAAATEHGKAVAGTAADQARQVADTASQQLSTVSGEAAAQARTVIDGATGELRDQLDTRLSSLAEVARTTSGELQALVDGRPEDAGRTRDLATQAGQRLGHLADRADELGVEGVVEEIGGFARRRPVVFLAGAAAAGVLVGRMARAGRQAHSDGDDGSAESRGADPRAASRTPVGVGAPAPEVASDPWPTPAPGGALPGPDTTGPVLTPPSVTRPPRQGS